MAAKGSDRHRCRAGLRRCMRVIGLAVTASAAVILATAAQAAPGNDAFANATVVSGASGTWSGTTSGATSETGEPITRFPTSMTVWYRWTAPSAAPVTFDTYGSASDRNTLTVFTGSSVNALTQVVTNTLASGNTSTDFARVTFTPVAGTTYSIQIEGWTAASYTLSMNPPHPANDDVANAQVITGETGSLATTNIRAGAAPTDPPALAREGTASVWYAGRRRCRDAPCSAAPASSTPP